MSKKSRKHTVVATLTLKMLNINYTTQFDFVQKMDMGYDEMCHLIQERVVDWKMEMLSKCCKEFIPGIDPEQMVENGYAETIDEAIVTINTTIDKLFYSELNWHFI
jgi:hypothetical protein